MSAVYLPYGDGARLQLHLVSLGALDDTKAQQVGAAAGFWGQSIGEAVHRQPYGLTTVPPPGGEGLFLLSGHRADRGHLIGLEHPAYRPTGNPVGSTTLYDMDGNIVSIVQANLRVLHASDVQVVVGGTIVRVRKNRIDLGAMTAPNPVMTTAGPSAVVFAV